MIVFWHPMRILVIGRGITRKKQISDKKPVKKGMLSCVV
jgi:hypothetical protein